MLSVGSDPVSSDLEDYDYQVFIPTMKRWDREIRSLKLFPNATLVVQEFEADKYIDKYPDQNIIIAPDSCIGNFAALRNFMIDNTERYGIQCDDDLWEVGRFVPDQDGKKHLCVGYDAEGLDHFVRNGFLMMEELNTVQWGVNVQSDPKFYREYAPISFHSPTLGPFTCFKKIEGLRCDERFTLTEDYDYFLQVMQKYHKVLRFNNHYYHTGHVTDSGGCGSYRTLSEEQEQKIMFQKKWGSKIVQLNFKKTINPRVRVPYKGI
jgi:hypothetical protein